MSPTGISPAHNGGISTATLHGNNNTKETFHTHHNDTWSTDILSKPLPAFATNEFDRQNSTSTLNRRVPDQPPQRFYIRPLVLILVPSLVTAYYAFIWIHLVQNADYDETVKYRTFSGSLIFYSWFMVGVFGLSWSKFGIVGLEGAMIRERFWAPGNLVVLLMHSSGTWGGPSGWVKAVVQRRGGLLWWLFAFLSVVPFVAFPLSGLVFEISDGFHGTEEAAMVVGRNRERFNMRYDGVGEAEGFADDAPGPVAWAAGGRAMIPGFGVLYTGGSVDRSKYDDFEHLPNTLPLGEYIPELFLAPQADHPISGKAWGLRFQYNCSVVQSVSEFTILSQKSTSSLVRSRLGNATNTLETPSGDIIFMETSMGLVGSAGNNLQAYLEVGSTAPRIPFIDGVSNGNGGDKYNEGYPGLEQELVFEYAVWQLHFVGMVGADHDVELSQEFNNTLEPSIEGLGNPFVKLDNGTWTVNQAFFTIKDGNAVDDQTGMPFNPASMIRPGSNGEVHEMGAPIGVRCVASSDLGNAELDGVTSSFSNFERAEPKVEAYHLGALRFGRTAEETLKKQFYGHFLPGGMAGSIPRDEHEKRFEAFLDPSALLRSVNLAYALDATNLMFDPRSGLTRKWVNEDLTATEEGKILSVASLVPGVALGNFVLALFCVWAALSAGLGLVYGFRLRPSARLDGYVMLRKGADMAGELKRNEEFMSGKAYGESETLAAMDGNVLGGRR